MWKIDKERGPWQTQGKSERKRSNGTKRELVMMVSPFMVRYKPKGTRTWFNITHEKMYELAVAAHVEATRSSKRRRTVKRGGV